MVGVMLYNGVVMDFSWSRHPQRYEYVINRGFITDKIVIDAGSGLPYGALAMGRVAKLVFAVDPKLSLVRGKHILAFSPKGVDRGNVKLLESDIFDFRYKADVCIAIEFIEHVADPKKLIKKLSEICEHAFITTPLADKTGKTDNGEHKVEYSAEDFDELVSKDFDILEKKYQTSDLRIVENAKSNGSSFNDGHVVQMVWCRSKNGSGC